MKGLSAFVVIQWMVEHDSIVTLVHTIYYVHSIMRMHDRPGTMVNQLVRKQAGYQKSQVFFAATDSQHF